MRGLLCLETDDVLYPHPSLRWGTREGNDHTLILNYQLLPLTYFSFLFKDLIITCLLVFFYYIADIAWAAGISELGSFHAQILKDKRNICLGAVCIQENTAPSPRTQSTVQLSFSVVSIWDKMAVCVSFYHIRLIM